MDLRKNLGLKWRAFRRLGMREAIRYKFHHRLGRYLAHRGILRAGTTYTLRAKDCRYPVHVRYNASDRDVFDMIFVQQEYACLRASEGVRLVIDCGANVGYAAAYFLSRYPQAHVIAVEPDGPNFALMERNLRPYADRVTLIKAGIWSHKAGLVLHRYGEGKEWSTEVSECAEGQTPDVEATDIPALLSLSGRDRIDILKVDIEGSETVLFNQESRRWMDRVKNIVVELHGPECESALFRALSNYEYDLSTSGELTVCQNIQPSENPR